MSSIVVPAITGLCWFASALLSIGCYSLRNFSRSRLEQICRARKNEDRFGLILKWDEQALQACELLFGFSSIALIMLFCATRYGAAESFSWWPFLGDLVGITVTLGLSLLMLPWSLSRVWGEELLYLLWPPLQFAAVATRPLRNPAVWIDTIIHRMAGRQDPAPETLESFTDELQSVVNEGEREGILESRAGRMLQRVMELRQEDVTAVMTPRTDIVTIPSTGTLEEARRILLDSGHSRIPVIGENSDDILGLLYTRDLLEQFGNPEPAGSLSEILREPTYIPETTSIDTLLEQMKRERFHMSIVLDEYGGVTGLVTLEDILEEIVGDIEDEFDEEPTEQIQRINDTTVEVDARVHIDDLNEQFDFSLPEDEDYDTIGGFVFSELGRIPNRGEKLNWRNLRLTVLDADKRKVLKVRIEVDESVVAAIDES
ncbi:MAG: hemolysin family protein [Maioricimonas sp. JB045]